MSRTVHLYNGIIVTDFQSEQLTDQLTVVDGIVAHQNVLLDNDTIRINLKGKCAIPGFVDSHIHLIHGASGQDQLKLHACSSRMEFEQIIISEEKKLSENDILIATGWSDHSIGEMPSKEWFPNNMTIPAICYRVDLHCAILNDSMLRCMDTQHIKSLVGGGDIEFGIVFEDALFNGVMTSLPAVKTSKKIERTINAISHLHAEGITQVGTMEHVQDIQTVLGTIQKLQSIRMQIMCLDEPTAEIIDICNSIHQDNFLSITGFKSFLDGSLSSRTAKMYRDWNDVNNSGMWTGHASKDTLTSWVTNVTKHGYAPVLHAIGDMAVGRALTELKHVPSSLTPRIEHAQCIAESDLDAISGKWFGVQPLHQPEDVKIASKALGEHRSSEFHNWRRMIDAGAKLSFGSDWPVAPPNPLDAIQVVVQHGLSPQEALVASTLNAALSLRSCSAGHLHEGAFGDVAILDKNPLECNWKDELPSVTMTILAGNIVYIKG